MLRMYALIVVAGVLSGCALGTEERLAGQNASCTRHAAERAQDAADNGYGGDIQTKIAKQVYADCQKWDRPVTFIQWSAN